MWLAIVLIALQANGNWPNRETVLRVGVVTGLIVVTEVRGNYIFKIEIWAVPTDTNADEFMLGVANRVARNPGFWRPPEEWIFPVLGKPLDISNIFAKAYDENGKVVATKFLPAHDHELHNVLWGTTPSHQ